MTRRVNQENEEEFGLDAEKTTIMSPAVIDAVRQQHDRNSAQVRPAAITRVKTFVWPGSPLLEIAAVFATAVLILLDLLILPRARAAVGSLAELQVTTTSVLLFSMGAFALALRLGLWLTSPLRERLWLRCAAGALLTCPFTSYLAVALFSGTKMATLRQSQWLPFVIAPTLAVIMTLALWGLVRLARNLRGWTYRPLLTVLPLGFASLAGWVDITAYPNQYAYLHWILLLFTVLALMAAGWLLATRVQATRWSWIAPVLLISSMPSFFLSARLSLDRYRSAQALHEHTHSAGRLVRLYQRLLDADQDGHSIIFGERDCNNRNAAVHPLATDRPNNGVDEDCDGRDAAAYRSKPSIQADPLLSAQRYRRRFRRWRQLPEFTQHTDKTQHYNVLLIVIDALRADQLRDTRANRNNHPTLFALADRSRIFTRAFSAGAGTDIGMGSIFSGQLNPFDARQPTLLESYQRAGFHTHGIYQREVNRWLGRKRRITGLSSRRIVVNDPKRRDIGLLFTGEQVSDHAITFLKRKRSKRFFLWLHYFDVHEHHQIQTEQLGLRAGQRADPGLPRYRLLLNRVDQQIARVLLQLAALALDRQTIVVIASDHGEGLAETPRLPNNHGDLLYNQLTHVPLIIHVPGGTPRQVGQPVSVSDIYPTLLDLARIRRPATHGLSLLPWLFDVRLAQANRLARPLLLCEAKQRAIISWPYKLITWWKRGLVELYDLEQDPKERFNLADTLPETVREMATELNRYPLRRIDRSR